MSQSLPALARGVYAAIIAFLKTYAPQLAATFAATAVGGIVLGPAGIAIGGTASGTLAALSTYFPTLEGLSLSLYNFFIEYGFAIPIIGMVISFLKGLMNKNDERPNALQN